MERASSAGSPPASRGTEVLNMSKRNSRTGRLYERELPGGGFVAIDVSLETRGSEAVPHTRVFVERRSDVVRRSGHVPPCIAEADADDSTTAFSDLLRIEI